MDLPRTMPTIRRSRNALKSAVGLSVLSALLLFGSGPTASAAEDSSGGLSIETPAREAYLVDFETGTVLLDKDSQQRMPPSSMSKLMTTVMLFDRLKEGSLSLDEEFRVSANAWRKGGAASGGSTMFLRPNETVRVEDLLRGIIVQSGNDACIVVAENLQGSEENFAAAMNRRAQEIGLSDSHFVNATGLPDENHYMTARDLAKLARYMLKTFPEYHGIYGEKEFTYNGISQHNRNPLLYTMPGADGLKTGHTEIAGYGLTGTAVVNGRRQILVINGLDSVRARSEEAQKLMDWGFRNFENKTLFTQGETITTADVWLGKDDQVPLMAQEDLRYTLPRRAIQNLDIKVVYTGPIPAPITKGQEIATLVIGGTDMADPIKVPLVAAADVERLGFVGRLMAAAKSLIFGSGGLENLAESNS
jgi:D-alanyl-D-alanine carboxypeptidase (penicillin-binding protein 5/6)